MKTLRRNLSLILVCLGALFFGVNAFSPLKHQKSKKKILLSKIGDKIITERPFVVIIPSYNNAKYYKKNLTSVFEQKYSNFRMIYIDDASPDGTGKMVEDWLKEEKISEKTLLIKNTIRKTALENLYLAIHLCRDEEILVFLDGDDWLAHGDVLKWLNLYYENPDVWMTYGSYVEYPSYRRSRDKEIPEEIHEKHSYRKASDRSFLAPHLQTGYAGLFKKVRLDDLQHEDKFFQSTYDRALFLPALEMAKTHAHYIRDVLYIYNRENVLNDDKVARALQLECKELIEEKHSYSAIISWRDEE